MSGKTDVVKGRLEEAAGALTGNDELRAEGKTDQAVGKVKQIAEKAVDKAEGAQQLRNEAQNEFRQSLADLSKLMWTREEGTNALGALGRELNITIKSLESRTGTLETGYANVQGRIWSVSALFAVIVLAVNIGFRFFGR